MLGLKPVHPSDPISPVHPRYYAEKNALLELYFKRKIDFDELRKELEILDSIEKGERVAGTALAVLVATIFIAAAIGAYMLFFRAA